MKKHLFILTIVLLSIDTFAQTPNLIKSTEAFLSIYQEEAKPYIIKMAEGRLDPNIKDERVREISLETTIGLIESSQNLVREYVINEIKNDESLSLEQINSLITNKYQRFYPSLDFNYYSNVNKRVKALIVEQ
jgi:hypothetical protein